LHNTSRKRLIAASLLLAHQFWCSSGKIPLAHHNSGAPAVNCVGPTSWLRRWFQKITPGTPQHGAPGVIHWTHLRSQHGGPTLHCPWCTRHGAPEITDCGTHILSHNFGSHLNTTAAPCICARDNGCGAHTWGHQHGAHSIIPLAHKQGAPAVAIYYWCIMIVRQGESRMGPKP
jgi:hypothetical protein